MRKVLESICLRRGESVTDCVARRRDLTDLWALQGRQTSRADRCPTSLQTHFQRAFLLNDQGYSCAYCGRTAWGVYAEGTNTERRTLRFEVDHRTARRLSPQKFDPDNLVAACRSCNVIKGEMPESALRDELRSLAAAVRRWAGS
jgi:5-methylcytosine-specific restriction endonuclease McrA